MIGMNPATGYRMPQMVCLLLWSKTHDSIMVRRCVRVLRTDRMQGSTVEWQLAPRKQGRQARRVAPTYLKVAPVLASAGRAPRARLVSPASSLLEATKPRPAEAAALLWLVVASYLGTRTYRPQFVSATPRLPCPSDAKSESTTPLVLGRTSPSSLARARRWLGCIKCVGDS